MTNKTKPKRKQVAIQLVKASKIYELHHEKPTLAEKMLKRQEKQYFTALDKIDLTIYKGEKVGIIGTNGSGKTTLLKIIAGISTLNSGSLYTNGKIVSLIDVSAGFHPDLTGIENIFLNGLVIGLNREEIQKKLDLMIAFADIGEFIHAPLYTYSEGMKLRLGFAIAIHANPDILILDEGTNVGDMNFQEKISMKIQELFSQKKTVIVVSHWLSYLQENCEKILWLKKGKKHQFGKTTIIANYQRLSE